MTATDVTRLTAADLGRALAAREVSAEEAARAHLERIAAVDPTVHAFLHVDAEGAVAAAREVDAKRARGEELGPLAGVPVAVKDVITTRGVFCTIVPGRSSHASIHPMLPATTSATRCVPSSAGEPLLYQSSLPWLNVFAVK